MHEKDVPAFEIRWRARHKRDSQELSILQDGFNHPLSTVQRLADVAVREMEFGEHFRTS
jgi:hypothetical protein